MAKKSLAVVFMAGYLTMFLCGCAEENLFARKKENEEPGIIHYATGAEQLKTYSKTKSKIEDISKARKKQYQLK